MANPNGSVMPTFFEICRTTSLAVEEESTSICRTPPSIRVTVRNMGDLLRVACSSSHDGGCVRAPFCGGLVNTILSYIVEENRLILIPLTFGLVVPRSKEHTIQDHFE